MQTPKTPLLPACSTVACVAQRFEALRHAHGLDAIPPDSTSALLQQLPQQGAVADDRALLLTLANCLPMGHPESLELAAPPTASWASHVALVRRHGTTVAVLKIFREPLSALLRELTALATVRGLKQPAVHAPRMFAAGMATLAGKPCGYVLMDAPGDTDLDALAKQVAAQEAPLPGYLRAVQSAARALAQLHDGVPASGHHAAVEAYRAQHVAYVQSLAQDPLDDFAARGWLSGSEARALREHIAAQCAAYERTPWHALPLGVVHGDSNPANFVVNQPDHSVHVIDMNTLLWSLGPSEQGALRGVADVREDIGRFVEALHVQAARFGAPPGGVEHVEEVFMQAYMRASKISRQALMHQHAEFFRLRYDAVVLKAAHRGDERKVSLDAAHTLLRHVVQRVHSAGVAAA